MIGRLLAGLAGSCAAVVVVLGSGARPPLGLDLYRPVPVANPQTRQKISLGRRLSHDRRLSRDGKVSCATCHDPRRAFADNNAVAVGVGRSAGRRNVPTIVNRVWGRSFFWDGRAASLEQQALQPIFNPMELGATPDDVLALARSRGYVGAFRRAFPAVYARRLLADA
jgi:cytochrome c peroxidase